MGYYGTPASPSLSQEFSQPFQGFPQGNSHQHQTFPPGFSQPFGNYALHLSGTHPPSDPSWYFDSGATSHVTNNASHIQVPNRGNGTTTVTVGNGQNIPVAYSGNGLLPTPSSTFSLTNLLHVPLISHNLLSVYQFASSLFILVQGVDLVYVLVYVDDILITGSDASLVDHIVKGLGSKFALTDLGLLHYFLGIKVVPVPEGLMLAQAKYALDLLKKAGMTDCRPCASPSSLKPYSNPQIFPSPIQNSIELSWGLSNI